MARQEEGLLDACPIYNDILEFHPRLGLEAAHGLTAGFPCQASGRFVVE